MSQIKKSIIRIGDRVRIIKPEFFIRCGYPLCLKSETQVVIDKYKKQIMSMIRMKSPDFRDNLNHYINKIAKEVAYARLRINGFGGNQRKIYTKNIEELKGKECIVVEIKYHKTGIYVAPQNYIGGEYEPGYLDDEKTHKILSLVLVSKEVYVFDLVELKIEATNVKLVKEY